MFLLLVSIMIVFRCGNSYSLLSPLGKSISHMKKHLTISEAGSTAYTSSESLKINITATSSLEFTGDLLVVPFYKLNSTTKNDSEYVELMKLKVPNVFDGVKQIIFSLLEEQVFKGDLSSRQVVKIMNSEVKYIALVGLGPDPKKEAIDLEITTANRLGKVIASIGKEMKVASVGVVMPVGVNNGGMSQLISGLHDGSYLDNRYKKAPEEGFPPSKFKSLRLLGCSEKVANDFPITLKLSEMIASGVHFAKDLVGAPSNSKNPIVIADLAQQMATEHGLACKILGETECKELKMGSYLGVQQGSMFPPRFIHLTYKPENPTADCVKVALIGKGLTFDSGGYNLKAGAGSMIEMMKIDMGGCAAVLGCAKAISQLKPKNVEVHFISAVCENMISAQAMRPGDILTASNGKTIEVLNTDAEGRLTLADALVYAEKLQVDSIIDLATLTGACMVALGDKVAGLYSSSDALLNEIKNAAKRTDELLWHLPLEMTYKEMIKSSIADLKNIGGKGAGSITAALFLQEFVEKTDWAHIDMAGPVYDSGSNRATGYGVKLLVDYLLNAKKKI